jgi:hypothetical protein
VCILGYRMTVVRRELPRSGNSHRLLDGKLNTALAALTRGNNKTAANVLNALLNEVDAQAGKQISADAVSLLKFNSQYLISKIQ